MPKEKKYNITRQKAKLRMEFFNNNLINNYTVTTFDISLILKS